MNKRKETYDLAMYEQDLNRLNHESIEKELLNSVNANDIDEHIKQIEKSTKKSLEILRSMTKEEKVNPSIIDQNRQSDISRRIGKPVEDIEHLLMNYEHMKKMYEKIHSKGKPTQPAGAAVLPIPERPVNTKAIGKKYVP
ncbi:MAG: hypothetical protein P8Y49_09275 [Sulfurovaceae bacterium]